MNSDFENILKKAKIFECFPNNDTYLQHFESRNFEKTATYYPSVFKKTSQKSN